MSRAPPTMPNSSGSHSYQSPKLGAAAIYSISSPSGSPRPLFAQHLPGTLSPYRDASSRYSHIGSSRISSLSRDATAALKASSYPTSSSRPTSPIPGSRSPSPSSDSGSSRASSSRGSHGPTERDAQDDQRPVMSRQGSSYRSEGASHLAGRDLNDDSAAGQSAASPSGSIKRVHQLQPLDTKGESLFHRAPW